MMKNYKELATSDKLKNAITDIINELKKNEGDISKIILESNATPSHDDGLLNEIESSLFKLKKSTYHFYDKIKYKLFLYLDYVLRCYIGYI